MTGKADSSTGSYGQLLSVSGATGSKGMEYTGQTMRKL